MTLLHCNTCGTQQDVQFNTEALTAIGHKGRYEVGFPFLEPEGRKIYKVKSIAPMQGWPDAEYLYLEEVPSTTG